MIDKADRLQQLFTSTSKTAFTTRDLNNIWKYSNYDSLIKRIQYFTKTKKLKKIKKGLYAIEGREINELELANKFRTPSYISFETVLHKEGIIFQWDKRITLAGKVSIQIEADDKNIVFKQIKDSILLNSSGIKEENNYYIATKERALLDMLYLNPSFQFDNLRSVDFDKIKNLLNIYDKKNLINIVSDLKKYAQSY